MEFYHFPLPSSIRVANNGYMNATCEPLDQDESVEVLLDKAIMDMLQDMAERHQTSPEQEIHRAVLARARHLGLN